MAFPSATAAVASAVTVPRAWSHAASSARRTTAPTSGDRRPRTTTIPFSSTHVRSDRVSCRRRSSVCSARRSTRRQARTIFSTWAAVPDSATFSRSSSVSGVATRVTARIFEYETLPRRIASLSFGRSARARATRTCSRAAPGSSPVRQPSHSAHDVQPAQPFLSSNCRMRLSSSQVAA